MNQWELIEGLRAFHILSRAYKQHSVKIERAFRQLWEDSPELRSSGGASFGFILDSYSAWTYGSAPVALLKSRRRRERSSGRATASLRPTDKADEQKPQEEEVLPRTWFEVEIAFKDGEPPPQLPYELELTNGKTRKGIVPGGRLRVDGIENPGKCNIKFQTS